jgi:hypothetical protein
LIPDQCLQDWYVDVSQHDVVCAGVVIHWVFKGFETWESEGGSERDKIHSHLGVDPNRPLDSTFN